MQQTFHIAMQIDTWAYKLLNVHTKTAILQKGCISGLIIKDRNDVDICNLTMIILL